jgi:hypothetical protein
MPQCVGDTACPGIHVRPVAEVALHARGRRQARNQLVRCTNRLVRCTTSLSAADELCASASQAMSRTEVDRHARGVQHEHGRDGDPVQTHLSLGSRAMTRERLPDLDPQPTRRGHAVDGQFSVGQKTGSVRCLASVPVTTNWVARAKSIVQAASSTTPPRPPRRRSTLPARAGRRH